MMADNELNNVDGDDDILVYTGGDQEVPRDVKRVRIAENVDTILERAFQDCYQLIEVEGHNRLRKVEEYAFHGCRRLSRVNKMQGLIEIEDWAFSGCSALSELEFDNLEIIGQNAFVNCNSLRTINMPSIRRVGSGAFMRCVELTDVVFGKDLERIEDGAFFNCTALRHIAISLEDNILIIDNNAFDYCENLSRVDTLFGEINRNISSLHMESWRVEMQEEMDRINQTLPNTHSFEKADAIKQWITRVLSRMEHFKSEHQMLVKEAMTLLELALWKAKLLNEADEKRCNVNAVTKNAKIVTGDARKEHRVTCGASIVIKNVLPFLALK